MNFLYLAALLVSLTGMVMLDRRFKLFFWHDASRATIVLTTGIVFFLIWDLTGIDAGVFFRGEGQWMTGIQLAPELPLEEAFFLTLLCYMTMNVFVAVSRGVSKYVNKAVTK
ncbi:lycopene cyclase domain-containing protein [uncultured Aurantimicrobium sp.]|uniref:lycopene cyclase domain-containing protein n=1 Tax=uncultured Aurantimicrobium sp. TaxID=1705357 RepID=UPI0026399598|nr:lycopene cyclase domain-containing protein [uncultured Aurantimicrobium sp.]